MWAAYCQIVFLENRVGDFCFLFPFSNNRSADDLSPLTLSYSHKRINAHVKNLRHGFLVERVKKQMRCLLFSLLIFSGTGVEFTQTCAFAKNISIMLSHDFGIFKGMSPNQELLSCKKMCGLLGFLTKMKVLQQSTHVRSWSVADTVVQMLIMRTLMIGIKIRQTPR